MRRLIRPFTVEMKTARRRHDPSAERNDARKNWGDPFSDDVMPARDIRDDLSSELIPSFRKEAERLFSRSMLAEPAHAVAPAEPPSDPGQAPPVSVSRPRVLPDLLAPAF